MMLLSRGIDVKRQQMVLVGALSNPKPGSVLQSLARINRDGTPHARQLATGWSDGRRRFGSVRDAIVQVLAKSDSDMAARNIHAEVERILGGQVSRSSVKGYLHEGSRGSVSVGLKLGDPIIGLVITIVIFRVTWQSWLTVRATEPCEMDV